MSKYYINDVGTEIEVDVCTDITAATVTNLKIKKPDGTEVTWTGTLSGLTFIEYTTQAGDWDQAGTYLLQAYVETPTWTGRGDTASFEIENNFK